MGRAVRAGWKFCAVDDSGCAFDMENPGAAIATPEKPNPIPLVIPTAMPVRPSGIEAEAELLAFMEEAPASDEEEEV